MRQTMDYQPLVLVETSNLPRDEWLSYRRRGIGGSDAAAVLGISPFQTGRDLYYDKLGIVTANDEENWVAKRAGSLLEPLVAEIFEYRTGLKVQRRPFMYYHPLYPWMLADLDYVVELPNGGFAILECKTTNIFGKDLWQYNGQDIVPLHYETQGRHYMAVTNLNRVYFCCYYTNSAEDAIIRCIDRDWSYEQELIMLEEDFWANHVKAQVLPPYIEDNGDLILQSIKRRYGPADSDAPPLLLEQSLSGTILHYIDLREQKSKLSEKAKKIDNEMKRLKGLIVDQMGECCIATCSGRDSDYTVTYKPSYETAISKKNLERLKSLHPDIYQEYAEKSEIRRFSIKTAVRSAA